MKNLRANVYILILLVVDVGSLLFSFEIATLLRSEVLENYLPIFMTETIEQYYWILLLIPLIFLFEKIYFIRYDFWGDTKRVYRGLILAFVIVLTILTLTKISEQYSRAFIVIFFLIAFITVPVIKRMVKRFLFQFEFFKIQVRILADDQHYDIIKNELIDNWYFGYTPTLKKFDMVLISSKKFKTNKLEQVISKYTQKTKDVYVIPYMSHLDISHATIVDYSNIRFSAIHIENKLLNSKNVIIKTLFEYILSLFIFPLMVITHFFISLAIKFDSKGNILFQQKRFGKNGKIYYCYKYRTMYENGDEILEEYLKKNPQEIENYSLYHKYEHDPRITKVGRVLRKLSLDEIPQFINVLKGEMALIGPRPYMCTEETKLAKSKKVILKVKPGITGLWQVSGRNELTFSQRVNSDIWYIQNWNLWLDFTIFVKTFKVLFCGKGAK